MRTTSFRLALLILLAAAATSASLVHAGSAKVATLRVPGGGLQPQVAVDSAGGVHMIYFSGDPMAGDIFYVKSSDGGQNFSAPLAVNSHSGSAVATGNIRGPHLALGKNGRPHVAWMGSMKAPKGPTGDTPMLYTRLNDAGTAFEPQRNVIQFAWGLDGGGTLAADAAGGVFVAWHGNAQAKGEQNRQVFVARSSDEGKTFARETPAVAQQTGACACCGMNAHAAKNGNLYILFRAALGTKNPPDVRDMFLLFSKDKGATFQGLDLHKFVFGKCVMSSAGFAEGGEALLATWETDTQVYFAKINPATGQPSPPVPAPGAGRGRKHSAVAANAAGDTLLAWTSGMGWQKGGSVEWQVFDKNGVPTLEKGKAEGVPANSLIAVFTRADGGFVVVY